MPENTAAAVAEIPGAVPHASRGTSAPGLSTRPLRLLALVAVYLVVVLLFPRPAAVTPAGWRVTALFLSTIAGLMLQPMPGAALVIVSLTMFVVVGGLPTSRVLSGFASPAVWLVFVAMLMGSQEYFQGSQTFTDFAPFPSF